MLFALGMIVGAVLGCLATALMVTAGKADSVIVEQHAAKPNCHCYNCNKDYAPDGGLPYTATHMIVCPICGNKRCPHATDHNNACSHSNDPGQPGSRYQ